MGGSKAQDASEPIESQAATEKSGWFRRFRFWLYCYDLEVALGLLVGATSLMILRVMAIAPDDAFTPYQAITSIAVLMILFVATVIMFNSARARESAAELLEELQKGGDDGEE